MDVSPCDALRRAALAAPADRVGAVAAAEIARQLGADLVEIRLIDRVGRTLRPAGTSGETEPEPRRRRDSDLRPGVVHRDGGRADVALAARGVVHGVLTVHGEPGVADETLVDLAEQTVLLLVQAARITDLVELRRRSTSFSVSAEFGWQLLPPASVVTDRVAPAAAIEPAPRVASDLFDETTVQALRSGRPAGHAPRWIAVGLATVALPFLAWPATVRPVLDVLAPGSAAVVLAPPALLVGGIGTAAAITVTLVADLLGGRRAAAGELALLTALFLVVPPLAAFGLYFGAWHGLRHLARLVALDPANAADLGQRRLARPVGRVLRQAALPTTAVLAALGVLLAVPGLAGRAVEGLVPAGLALVLALTVPHMAVVAVMDRRQRPGGPPEVSSSTPASG